MAYKKIKSEEPAWINISDSELTPEGNEGFIYLITNLKTGKKYIGRKYFWKRLRKKVPGKARRIRVTEESDWKTYWGSCAPLHEDYFSLGIMNFKREILSIHDNRPDVCYEEVAAQFKYNVLRAVDSDGNYQYYNSNIGNKYYRRTDESYDRAGEKISESLKAGHKDGTITHPMSGKVHPNRGKQINSGHTKMAKEYRLKDPDGNIFVGTNLSDLSRRYNLDLGTIAKVNRGVLNQHKQWTRI